MMLDTHVHTWGPPSVEHPWTNAHLVKSIDAYAVDAVYDVSGLLADMEKVGIEDAIIVGFPIGEWTDNSYTIEAATSSDRLSGIVLIDPFESDAPSRLREYMSVDSILGFRLGVMCPYESMWNEFDADANWLPDALNEASFWDTAIETEAVVELLVHESQLDQASMLVDRYPELTYVIDHFAYTSPETQPIDSDFAKMSELAAHEHTVAKVSGIQKRSLEPFPFEDMHDHVTWLLDEFGRERIVWGSDFPNVSDDSTYADSLAWLDHVDTLTTKDKSWIREKSARELFEL